MQREVSFIWTRDTCEYPRLHREMSTSYPSLLQKKSCLLMAQDYGIWIVGLRFRTWDVRFRIQAVWSRV
jgi:hypothetical protein